MLCKLLIACVLAASYMGANGADIDCSKRPERMDPHSCCPMPHLITEKLMETCKPSGPPGPHGPGPNEMANEMGDMPSAEPGRRPGHHHHRHHHFHPCMAECIFNETKIVVDNKLDEAKLREFLKEALVNNTDFVPVFETSFKTCFDKKPPTRPNGSEDKRMRGPPPGHMKCSPRNGFVMGCAMKETFQNCPASAWNNTQACNDAREFFKKCHKKRGENAAAAGDEKKM